MLKYNNKIEFDKSQCQQCGLCKAICPKNAITLCLKNDGLHDIIIDSNKCIQCKKCVKTCPANIHESYYNYFEDFANKKYFFGYNANNAIRRESSSGGVCKTIVIESLKNDLADGVYTLRRTDKFPYAEGEFYTEDNIPDYDDIPNSVYHSLLACCNITKIKKCKRLIVIGTSCQLRAMNRALTGKAEEIIRVCIFCKQQKTLDSTRFLAKIMGTQIPKNLKFFTRYRGNGWPGIVRLNESELPWHRAAQIPFGRRLWTVPGCNVCGDSFGTNAHADITLMDPWKIRKANDLGETLIIVHTDSGLRLLEKIHSIKLEQKNFQDIEPALDIKDVWRKQQLVPFFRGDKCEDIICKAGKAEQRQRKILRTIVEKLPRMPILFYRILCRIPDMRNKILK